MTAGKERDKDQLLFFIPGGWTSPGGYAFYPEKVEGQLTDILRASQFHSGMGVEALMAIAQCAGEERDADQAT